MEEAEEEGLGRDQLPDSERKDGFIDPEVLSLVFVVHLPSIQSYTSPVASRLSIEYTTMHYLN